MSVAAVSRVSHTSAYAALSELRSDRAQLLADIAAGADARVIAADNLNVTTATHRVIVQAGRFDAVA